MQRTAYRTMLALAVALAATGFVSCQQQPDLPEGLYAVMKTAKGELTIQLAYDKAPLTVGNFVGLAEGTLDAQKGKRFFDGLVFHRVEPGFVVQGGDPAGNGSGGPGYEFPNEIHPDLAYDAAGVVGMANAGPDTNGSQFFITLAEAPFLTGGYSVFGKVVKGMEVVQKFVANDMLETVTIWRIGAAATAFKTDQASWNERSATLSAASKAKAAAQRAGDEAAIAKKWPTLKKDANGIWYQILRAGPGPVPAAGAKVTVNYKGMFLDGSIFDQSSAQGGPFSLTVGAGQVIPGWDKTLLAMKKGEKRLIVLPPELAYGAQGAGGVIPPNAYLAFEMELVEITK